MSGSVRTWIVASLVLCSILPAKCCEKMSQESGGSDGKIGSIDTTLFLKHSRNKAHFLETGGLYLLPDQVPLDGKINRVCAFGYTREEFRPLLNHDLITARPIVYVLLYRPSDSGYTLVNEPAILYHGTSKSCLTQMDELNWNVQKGDRMGAFIPEDLINVTDIPRQTISNIWKDINSIKELYPSQILLNDTGDCFVALYVNTTLGLEALDHILFKDITERFLRLNLEVFLEEPHPTSVKATTVTVVLSSIAAIIFSASLVICTVSIWKVSKMKRIQRQASVSRYAMSSTSLYSPPNAFQKTTSKTNPGYEMNDEVVLNGCIIDVPSNEDGEHDYDEPYFQPADEEEDLLQQLHKLAVPNIAIKFLRIHEFLGSGAFGTVHRGVWLHSGGRTDQVVEEEVAVKSMESGASEEERVKFLQEAAIMGQFNHPNIIQLLGVVYEGKLRIVINLMKADLKNHLIQFRPVSIEDEVPTELSPTLLSFSRQVAFGMLYLSAKSFVHRDLAARNILVSHDGTTCKIADFGLSRELEKQSFYVSHGGKIPVKWTAPEALHYHKYSTASDVWSYGCVLYEIWSLGVKPFQEILNHNVMKLLESGYRLPPPPGCPRVIYDTMIRCWNPEEGERLSFCDVVVSLQLPDYQILNWLPSDRDTWSKVAMTLGASIEHGSELYTELQRIYTKEVSTSVSQADDTFQPEKSFTQEDYGYDRLEDCIDSKL